MRVKIIVICILITILSVSPLLGILFYKTFYLQNNPEILIKDYYSSIAKKDYERMYDLLCQQSQKEILKDDFIRRNSAIYEGIEISKLNIYFDDNIKQEMDSVNFHLSFDTVAGPVSAEYSARLVRENVITTDSEVDHPILIISMVENVKNLGGSGYVVEKTRYVLEQYFNMDQDD